MIIDDEQMILDMLRISLKWSNIKVITAKKCGEECTSKAENQQPDIILLDINMRGMDDLELCPGNPRTMCTCPHPILNRPD